MAHISNRVRTSVDTSEYIDASIVYATCFDEAERRGVTMDIEQEFELRRRVEQGAVTVVNRLLQGRNSQYAQSVGGSLLLQAELWGWRYR